MCMCVYVCVCVHVSSCTYVCGVCDFYIYVLLDFVWMICSLMIVICNGFVKLCI